MSYGAGIAFELLAVTQDVRPQMPGIDRIGVFTKYPVPMSIEKIYPRSPLESMAGWVHLPRLIDKVRLHLAGKLPEDYQPNYLNKGFDARWLETAEVDGEKFVEVVKKSLTDGQVCDWVIKNVKVSDRVRNRFKDYIINYGREGDEVRAKLKQRKEESGIADREDIQCFVDYIDADEGRI